jgi:hypothetical protein
MYWRRRLRGVESEMRTAAMKKEIYRLALDAIQRMAGRLGLKDGAIPEYPGVGTLGIGITGGWDWGPWGPGSRASSEVASSIYPLERAFATRILHAIAEALSIGLDNTPRCLLKRDGECAHGLVFAMKENGR